MTTPAPAIDPADLKRLFGRLVLLADLERLQAGLDELSSSEEIFALVNSTPSGPGASAIRNTLIEMFALTALGNDQATVQAQSELESVTAWLHTSLCTALREPAGRQHQAAFTLAADAHRRYGVPGGLVLELLAHMRMVLGDLQTREATDAERTRAV